MAQVRKYANLPDLDNAPDIYETPDLTDDASTLQTATTARSPSPDGLDPEDATGVSGVNRQRIHPDQARTRFLPSRVDAREADFSDNLSSKRQSYKVSSRRRRRDGAVIENEDEDEDDWSAEDEEEGLERRLARLQREVEEVKAEVARRKVEEGSTDGTTARTKDTKGSIEKLSKALDAVRNSQRDAVSAHAQLSKQLSKPPPAPSTTQTQPPSTISAPQADTETTETTQTLSRVADFESRLTALERSLGLSSLDTTPSAAILPTLALLDTQVALLTSSEGSLPHIETLTQRLHDAAAATTTTTRPPIQRSSTNGTTIVTSADESEDQALTPETKAKLNSLFALLPTLTSLSPTLPPLLARLMSLRTLHAGAATANQLLDEIEKRQEETEKEIRAWREGLGKVERAVEGAEAGLRENVGVVEGWVKELEGRVRGLNGAGS